MFQDKGTNCICHCGFIWAMSTPLHSWYGLAKETCRNCRTSPFIVCQLSSLTQPCHPKVWVIGHTILNINRYTLLDIKHLFRISKCCIHSDSFIQLHQGQKLFLKIFAAHFNLVAWTSWIKAFYFLHSSKSFLYMYVCMGDCKSIK